MPEKWTLFDTNAICEEFGVQITVKENVTYFLCEIEDGFEPVFDAVDFIIAQNKALEEKTELLKEKVEVLRSLFEKEPLEKLKTLHFVFDDTMSSAPVTLPVDIKQQLKKKDKSRTKNNKENVNDSPIETTVTDEVPVDKQSKKKTRKTNNNDSSLMNFVKDELENE